MLVVGTGMAAQATVESLLAHRPDGFDVTMVGAEPELPYNRVRLSTVLAGAANEGELQLRDGEWFAQRGIELRTATKVTQLDVAAREATLDDGSKLAYDSLVLATGSRPALPPIDGLGRTGVHVFRTLGDARELLARAQPGRSAVVIGGGLLGLEAARGLHERGMRVSVIELAPQLMEAQLDALAAGQLAGAMADTGIDVRVGAATDAVLGNGHVEGVQLAGGEQLTADLVVVATGIRAETELAHAAGLEVGRGVLVDDSMRASAAGVWAVGECAEHRGIVYGLWTPLLEQARVAGATLAGEPAAFHGAIPATTLKVMGVSLFCAGRQHAGPGEHAILALDSRHGRYRKLVLSPDGRLQGAILLGDLSESGRLRELIAGRERVPDELFESTPAEPDQSEVVCSCNVVTRATLELAIKDRGIDNVEQLAAATQATTGCGGCRPAVERLLATAA